jgi:hypothetical protein
VYLPRNLQILEPATSVLAHLSEADDYLGEPMEDGAGKVASPGAAYSSAQERLKGTVVGVSKNFAY